MFKIYDATKPYDNQMGYPEDVLERFWSKVDVKKLDDGSDDLDACMEWTASKNSNDYGDFGYEHISNNTGNKITNILAHRFSWSCYNGPLPIWGPPDWLCVRHKNFCHNPSCVNPLHLEVGTRQQNMDDMVELGTQARGSSHGMTKLSDENVFEIVELSNSGMSQQKIANKFGVIREVVSKIITGQNWSHLTGIKYNPAKDIKGVNHGMSKLDDNKVREIRQKSKEGRSGMSLAKEYNIHFTTTYRVINKETWPHVV